VPVSLGNIGHFVEGFHYQFSDLARVERWTENPRVGGSIPPLATIQINISNQEVASERMALCPIFAPVSNILVGCSL